MYLFCVFVFYEIFSLSLALQPSPSAVNTHNNSGETSKLHVLNVQISEDDLIPHENCLDILQSLEKTISTASDVIHNALDGCLFIQTVNVFLPNTWHDSCLPKTSSISSPNTAPYSSSGMDVTITSTHRIFKDKMWTKQHGSCGIRGSQIYIPYKSLGLETSGKELVKDWSKYQFGIFDEHGYANDPVFPLCYFDNQQTSHITSCSDHEEIDYTNNCISSNFVLPISDKARTSLLYAPEGPNVSMFCDSGNHEPYAPTKQNYLCKRKPTLDIILNDPVIKKLSNAFGDRSSSTNITNTIPNFIYHRSTVARYIVIIDDSIDNARRDAWNFLRIAIRKWVLYDLKGKVEIGILLASGDRVIRSLDLTQLNSSTERELVSAFLPYTTNTIQSSFKNTRATCLTCALKQANNMLDRAQNLQPHSGRNTILVVSPGLDLNVDTEEKIRELASVGKNNYVVTINYPDINNRQPLDRLALELGGSAFTVQEQRYNSERSNIQTYFQLSTLMMQLAHVTHSSKETSTPGHLEEIYRNVIYEANAGSSSKQNLGLRLSKGHFQYDADTYDNAEFLVYTHATDLPLISGLKLTSPSGRTFTSLSDQRMGVKQLTVLASIDETGLWQYTIEHYNSGTTQPHIVQVVALTKPTAHIQTHLHIHLSEPRVVTVACEVFSGKYPILNANVTLLMTRYESTNPNVFQREFIDLLDNGLGSGSDLTRNDGIYTTQISIAQPSIYSFEVKITGSENKTFTVREYADDDDDFNNFSQKCCGSFYSQQIENEIETFKKSQIENTSIDFKYLQTVKTFERYTNQKTIYVQGDFSNSSRQEIPVNIFDFNVCHPDADEDLIELSWSLPNKNLFDLSKKPQFEYEIRFSQNLKEIIEYFDTCEKLDSSIIQALNNTDRMVYTIHIDKLPSHVRGKILTFAIREIATAVTSTRTQPISNIQQLLIKHLPPKATTAQIPHIFNTYFQDHPSTTNNRDIDDALQKKNTNTTYYAVNATDSREWSIKTQILYYIIPALIALILVVIISYLLWFIVKCRRNSKSPTKNNNKTTVSTITKCSRNITNSSLNYSATASADIDAAGLIQSRSSETGESQTLYTADHHTLGIPIYTQEEDDNNSTLKNTNSMYADSNEDQSYRIVSHSSMPPTVYSIQQGLVTTNYLNAVSPSSAFHLSDHEALPEGYSHENCYLPIDYDNQIPNNCSPNTVAYNQLITNPNNKYDLGLPTATNSSISNTPPPLPPAPTIPILNILNYSYNHESMPPTNGDEELCHRQQNHHHQPHHNHPANLIHNNSSLLIEGVDISGIAKRSRNVTMV